MEAVKTTTSKSNPISAAMHVTNLMSPKTQENSGSVQSPSPLFIQTKLSIGSPDDEYEKEADAMADKVMRMEMPGPVNFSLGKNNIQRKCAQCEEEDKKLQKKESSSGESSSVAPPIVHDVLSSSSGKPMDTEARSFMESRFNYDFANVKIHDNEVAAKSASAINALAYTSGNNIVFNSGQYNINSDSGKKLLAHELTHVRQQQGAINNNGVTQTHLGGQQIQRKWSLDRIEAQQQKEADHIDGNASTGFFVDNSSSSSYGMAGAAAKTWQEASFYINGGQAQAAFGITKHFVFRNDGADSDFLELSMNPFVSGNAKAEDTNYARAAGIVWGEVTERTAANPTPQPKLLFHSEEGALSTATVGDLGTIEADIPVGSVSTKVNIKLTRVKEGELGAYSESDPKYYSVPVANTEVDVLLGAQAKADADITTDFWGTDGDVNKSLAISKYNLQWSNRPLPPAVKTTPVAAPTGPDDYTAQKSKLSYPSDCKRNTLVGAANKGGCSTREGGSHTVVNKGDRQITTIPRTVKENGTCRSIIKVLNDECL